ncbi:MAG: BamA/TamA family outer membrane protein [Bacteroidaceae bacterium]|nr:BamA/TamA family outer membrane protein [Bacteroidaceae bacterium]
MKGNHFILLLLLCLLASACSLTKRLPEGETLYRGIKSIDYDKMQEAEGKGQEQGVITALADAYTTVEGLLSGDASAMKQEEEMDEKELRDSLRRASQKDKEAYEATREEVEAVLSYAPNGAFMGSSTITHPFPIRLLIYNRYAGSKSRFGKWMFNHFAASPVLISNVNPRLRSTVAKNTLRSRGYFRARTSYEVLPDRRDTLKGKVRYDIHPGPLYHLDSIAYMKFPPQADSIIRNSQQLSELHRGDPFSVVNLEAERTRIVGVLREEGYYYQRNDYIAFRADTLQTPMMVKLQVQPSPTAPSEAMHPYYIGNTRVNIYKYGDRQIVDSLTMRGGYSFGYSRPVKFRERVPGSKKMPKAVRGQAPLLRPRAVWRSMLFRKGDLYKQSLSELMQDGLASTNVFSSVRVNYVPRQDSLPLRDGWRGSDTLDIVVNATLDKPYDAEFQGNVTGKTEGQVGPGASFSFSKKNAFRAAETLTLKVWGSYEWQTGANVKGKKSLLNSYEYGLSGSLLFPRFRFFGLGRKLGRKFVSTTAFDLQARWQNRAGFFGRVSWSGGINYTLQHKQNIKHEFSPLTISYDQLLHSTAHFDSIVAANPALYVSMRDQFVPSMSYSFSWAGNKKRPSSLSVTFKEASALLSSIYAISGEPFGKEGKKLLGVPFAQFVKTTVQYTRQFPLTKRSLLAMRAFGGIIYSYGNAKSAPYGELFSVGGANSIRAFGMRTIGPGAYHPAKSQYSYVDQMGDIKLEANLEYRFPIVGQLQGAAFIDAGNVWLLREGSQQGGRFNFKTFGEQIALGTGVGLRYDLDFLVIRFDLGIGIHAPYDTGKRGYYNMPSFGRSLGYHFAIGYPF